MWTKPQSTIRAIVLHRPSYGIYLLAMLYALQGFFFYANWWSLGVRANYALYLLLGILLSPLLGLLWLYVGGELFYLTGHLFKGKGTRKELRAALAWSALPYTLTLTMWVLLLFCSPEYVFLQDSGPISSLFTNSITLIAKVWSFILMIQCLKELQSFSLGKAILNILIVGLLTWILFFLTFSLIRPFVI